MHVVEPPGLWCFVTAAPVPQTELGTGVEMAIIEKETYLCLITFVFLDLTAILIPVP